MIDTSTIKKKLETALQDFSREKGVPGYQTQISISKSEKGLSYSFLHNYRESRAVNFKKDILKIGIDIFSYEQASQKIISTGLEQLAAKHNCSAEELEILICRPNIVTADIQLYLYKDKGKTNLGNIPFEEFFAMENLIKQ